MHEMSIATQLIETVVSEAARHDAGAVCEVVVEVGRVRAVVPEAMQLAWQAVREGTIAAKATLKLIEVPIQAACRHCGNAFAPEIDDYLCPACGRADVDITTGNDIILKSLSCEQTP